MLCEVVHCPDNNEDFKILLTGNIQRKNILVASLSEVGTTQSPFYVLPGNYVYHGKFIKADTQVYGILEHLPFVHLTWKLQVHWKWPLITRYVSNGIYASVYLKINFTTDPDKNLPEKHGSVVRMFLKSKQAT